MSRVKGKVMQSGEEGSSREAVAVECATTGEPHLEGATRRAKVVVDREARARLVLGVLFFIPLIPAALAVVLGVRAWRRLANREHGVGRGTALAGIICGVMSLAIGVAGVVGVVEFKRA